MNLSVNGTARDVPEGTSVALLVGLVAPTPRGVAVARNGEIVARSAWDSTVLAEGDRIEILGAAQGG